MNISTSFINLVLTYAQVKKQEIKQRSQHMLQQKSWIIPSKPAPAAMMGAIRPQTRAVWSDMVKEKSSGYTTQVPASSTYR